VVSSVAPKGEFAELSFNKALDPQPYLEGAPSDGTAKGMFLSCIVRLAREKSGQKVGLDHYTAFKGYPITDWIRLLPQCAQLAYPHLPMRAALFEIGGHIYKTFAESTIGRVVMSVAGRDPRAALRLVTRAYDSVGATASVILTEQTERRSVVEFRDMWEYPDCYQPGILAAGVRAYGENPKVRVRVHSRCNVDVEITW
jgi:uncharacterized protein (TIGR02265 family)